jgi:hypothetical protein
MPKVRASSGMIGTMRGPRSLSRIRLRRIRVKTIVVETAVWLPPVNSSSTLAGGVGRGALRTTRRGSGPPELAAALLEVLDLLGVRSGVVVRRVLQLAVRDRQLEPVAEDAQLVLRELLRLVGDVAGLDAGAERPALHRVGEDHRRGTLELRRRLVRRVDLAVVVAAAAQLGQVVVAQVVDELAQPRVRPEEVLPDVRTAGDAELLELAVERVVHLLDEHAVDVAGQQLVPLAGPDDLDDVPAATAEDRLELLDDLAVAADRTVEALQVAVDDEGQVVEALARGDDAAPERLGLVGLAVAEERPDPRLARVEQAAVLEVAVEAGLVDGRDRPRPIETVGYSQNSGISRGCGYELRPWPGTVSRRKWSSWPSVRRPSRNARAYIPGAAWPW